MLCCEFDNSESFFSKVLPLKDMLILRLFNFKFQLSYLHFFEFIVSSLANRLSAQINVSATPGFQMISFSPGKGGRGGDCIHCF